LLDALKIYRKSLPAKCAAPEALIFSTRTGRFDTHMIRALKRNAKKARLSPEDFWLHKFRATFATTHLRAGVDLKTVMAWMGQTTMDSIIRYLINALKLQPSPAGSHVRSARTTYESIRTEASRTSKGQRHASAEIDYAEFTVISTGTEELCVMNENPGDADVTRNK